MPFGYRIFEGLIHLFFPSRERRLWERIEQTQRGKIILLRNTLYLGIIILLVSTFLSTEKWQIHIVTTNILIGVSSQTYRTYLRIKYGLHITIVNNAYKKIFKKDLPNPLKYILTIIYSTLIFSIILFGLLFLFVTAAALISQV